MRSETRQLFVLCLKFSEPTDLNKKERSCTIIVIVNYEITIIKVLLKILALTHKLVYGVFYHKV